MFPHTIDPTLAGALTGRGYTTLTPVQTAVLDPETAGRDLLVSARTGSGKTVAYGLMLAETLLNDGVLNPGGPPLALVIAPTRELAMQVQTELQWLYAGAKVVSCVGGMDPRAERRALEQGCHVVVGTPGRLRDHLERGNLRLERLGCAVLDEADEMLDLGFKEELEEILDATPKTRRTLLFSATLPRAIVNMASAYQNDALRLTVGAGEQAHADIEYRAVRIAPSEVELATVNVLRYFDSSAAIVFCSTREGVRKLHANLVERGFSVVALSGELSQAERSHALQALRDRRARVCVATDVAARGIDIPDLDLVIHADLPTNHEVMQHRSGRTGRAGRKGVCVILATHPRRKRVEMLLRNAKITAIWQGAPTAEEIRAKDQQRMIDDVAPAADADESDTALAYAIMAQRSPEAIAAAYVKLARKQMPSAEDLSDSQPEPGQYAPENRDTPRPGFEDAVWFSIDLGRSKNAEARWILPMICRRGHLTKSDIGAIRIFERETRFQIAASAVERFEAQAHKEGGDGGKIERLDGNEPPPARDRNTSSSRHRAASESSGEAPRSKFKPRGDRPEYTPREPREKTWQTEAPAAAPDGESLSGRYDPIAQAAVAPDAAYEPKAKFKFNKNSLAQDRGPRSADEGHGKPAYGDKPRGDFKPREEFQPRGKFGGPKPESAYKPKGDFKPRGKFDGPPGEKTPWRAEGPKPEGAYKPKGDFKPRGKFDGPKAEGGYKGGGDFRGKPAPKFEKANGSKPKGKANGPSKPSTWHPDAGGPGATFKKKPRRED